MSAWYFFLLTLLIPCVSALADDSSTDVGKAVDVRPEKAELSTKMQALLETITTPDTALQESREYQQNGQFGLAKIVLQHGIELAKSSGSN